jgi:hypothetical protein
MASERQEIGQRRGRLQVQLRVLSAQPLMRGSLYVRRRRCGRTRCACARDPAARHASRFLTVFLDGRTQGFHLRPEDEAEVRRAVAAYDRLWGLVNDLTGCAVAELRRRVRERRRQRART